MAGQVRHTQDHHTGRAGIHRGLERRIVGCTDCHHTGCRHNGVAGCRRTEVGEDPAGNLHILAAGVVGSHIGPGSDIRRGLTYCVRCDMMWLEV